MIYTLTLNPAVDKTYLVEALEFDGVNRPYQILFDSGGKGFNVSRALVRLGVNNRAIGFAGGAAGRSIQHDLTDQGIEPQFIWLAEETRTNTVLRENSGHYIKINETGPTVQPKNLEALFNLVAQTVSNGDIWVLCGSLPRGIPANFYGELTQQLHQYGVIVGLDASGEAFRLGLDAVPDIIKPNQFEAWEVLGEKIPVEKIPDRFHAMGIKTVILSLGEDGVIISDYEQRYHIHPPTITIQNPVGAGDAAFAGAIYGIFNHLSLCEIGSYAVACGTAAAASVNNCYENESEVERVFQTLKVDVL